MTKHSRVREQLLVIGVASIFALACTTSQYAAPNELLSFARPAKRYSGGEPQRTFVDLQGRTRPIRGEPDLRVALVGGGVRHFDGPVTVLERDGGRVSLAGQRQDPLELSLDTIQHIEVRQTSVLKGFGWAGVVLLGTLGAMFILVGLTLDEGDIE